MLSLNDEVPLGFSKGVLESLREALSDTLGVRRGLELGTDVGLNVTVFELEVMSLKETLSDSLIEALGKAEVLWLRDEVSLAVFERVFVTLLEILSDSLVDTVVEETLIDSLGDTVAGGLRLIVQLGVSVCELVAALLEEILADALHDSFGVKEGLQLKDGVEVGVSVLD